LDRPDSPTRPAIVIRTRTPRDRHTPTIRLIPFRSFPGMPLPGMPVDLHTPGVTRPVPGYVHSFDADAGIVRVEPDFQIIRA
jgi:hypothetical protein